MGVISPGDPRNIKSIQTVVINITPAFVGTNAQGFSTGTIQAVDTTKSFVFLQGMINLGNVLSNGMSAVPLLTDATTVTCVLTDAQTTNNIIVYCCVVEYQ